MASVQVGNRNLREAEAEAEDRQYTAFRNVIVMFLIFAGVLLQFCTHEARILAGNRHNDNRSAHFNKMPSSFDLELLSLFASCLRAAMSMVVLIILRKFFTQAVLSFATNATHRTSQRRINVTGNAILHDLMFHLQCRFFVCSILCLTPANLPAMAVDFAILVVSTLNQQVFHPRNLVHQFQNMWR